MEDCGLDDFFHEDGLFLELQSTEMRVDITHFSRNRDVRGETCLYFTAVTTQVGVYNEHVGTEVLPFEMLCALLALFVRVLLDLAQ